MIYNTAWIEYFYNLFHYFENVYQHLASVLNVTKEIIFKARESSFSLVDQRKKFKTILQLRTLLKVYLNHYNMYKK